MKCPTAIVVDFSKGTGKFTLFPYDKPLFRLQPAEPIMVKQVQEYGFSSYPNQY